MAVAINYLSLFAGHAGLDLGFRLGCEAIGIVARCVGYVEREAYAASCLMGRMEESALERAPVFCGDIRDVRGSEFRGIENLWIIGGFPCQDISFAGKGAGIVEGNRSGLWFEYARLAEESGAVGVFAENVAAIIGRGLDVVLQDLARLGFDAEWDCFTASQVGAPHKRERWFCLAHRRLQHCDVQQWADGAEPARSGDELAQPPQRGQRERGQSPAGDGLPDGGSEELAHAKHSAGSTEQRGEPRSESRRSAQTVDERLPGGSGEGRVANAKDPDRGGRISGEEEGTGPGECGRRGPSGGRAGLANAEHGALSDAGRESLGRDGLGQSGEMGNATGARRQGWSGVGRCADELLPFPPGPTDRDAWARIIEASPHLAPAIEPGVRVLVDGLELVVDESRADQLRGGGNGVVPLQAALAFVSLARRLGLA